MPEFEEFTIHPENDFGFYLKARHRSSVNGQKIPTVGLASVRGFISATNLPTAGAIHTDLDVALPEVPNIGGYLGSITGDKVTVHLDNATYWDKVVYAIVKKGSNIRVVTPVVLRRARVYSGA